MDEKLPLVENIDERLPIEAALKLVRALAENAAIGLGGGQGLGADHSRSAGARSHGRRALYFGAVAKMSRGTSG